MNGHAKWILGAVGTAILVLAVAGAKSFIDPTDRKAEAAQAAAARAESKAYENEKDLRDLERTIGKKTTDIEIIKANLQNISRAQDEMKENLRELKQLIEKLSGKP